MEWRTGSPFMALAFAKSPQVGLQRWAGVQFKEAPLSVFCVVGGGGVVVENLIVSGKTPFCQLTTFANGASLRRPLRRRYKRAGLLFLALAPPEFA